GFLLFLALGLVLFLAGLFLAAAFCLPGALGFLRGAACGTFAVADGGSPPRGTRGLAGCFAIFLRMQRRFDLVSVEIVDEGAVIVGAVIRTRSGLAIVAAAGLQRFFVEFQNRFLAARGETDVNAVADARRIAVMRNLHP